jgi:hypothetical protein
MTVDTDRPVFEAAAQPTAGDAADTQEILRTMAAVVRTMFGVSLRAPLDSPSTDAAAAVAEPAQAAPVSLALPPESPTLVAVPVAAPDAPPAPSSIAVDFPPLVQVEAPEQPVSLAVVPDAEPAESTPTPSISLGDSSWAPAPAPPAPVVSIPANSPVEPAVSLPTTDGYPAAIAVPAYAAPVLQEYASDRHSLALLQEIAFLDD